MNRLVLGVLLLAACSKEKEDYLRRSKTLEAQLQLKRLTKLATYYVESAHTFPKGNVGPTPASACCENPDKKCAPNPANWTDPVWSELGFQVEEPHYFQYSYTSDGTSFTVTAVGDLACSGSKTTVTASGTLKNGVVVIDDSQLTVKKQR